jgi:hypothetical protein
VTLPLGYQDTGHGRNRKPEDSCTIIHTHTQWVRAPPYKYIYKSTLGRQGLHRHMTKRHHLPIWTLVQQQRTAAKETSQCKLQTPITSLCTLVHSISSGRETTFHVSQPRKRLAAANVTQQPLASRPDFLCSNFDNHLSTRTHVCILTALGARWRED